MSIRVRGEVFNRLSAAAEDHDRPLGHEVEQRLEISFKDDDALGGSRVAALFRYLASLIGDRDDDWLSDRVIFNTVTSRWAEHLDAIRPKLSPSDEALEQAEYEELRQFIAQGETPAVRNARRQIARQIATTGSALDPAMRARYATLAVEQPAE